MLQLRLVKMPMSTENERDFDDFAVSIANLLDDAVAVIKDLKQNLSTGGEYCICRDDGKEMTFDERRNLKAIFERGDALINNANEQVIERWITTKMKGE